MSKRLQILVEDEEMKSIKQQAALDHVPVGEYVRRTLRDAQSRKSVKDPEAKLAAVRKAFEYSFDTADIEQMNREIMQGYLS